ncbi:MAG: APC family permease [Alphaproteobacteria bacterium]|nr:APC family permease [Alphaproteobacteria bacterium]
MSNQLKANSLSFFESLVMGIAGSAPGYTIAVTTAVLIATAGKLSPGALVIFAVPMLGIAVAYKALSKLDVSAGAAYQWTTAACGKFMGFLSGWALLLASMVFMVTGSIPVATATLDFIDPALAGNVFLTAAVASAWFLAVASVLITGIEITSRMQLVMTGVELVILVVVLVAAFVHAAHVGLANPFSWSWFSFAYTPGSFAASALAVIFFYWGWDVTANLGEETIGGGDSAGNGGFSSVFVTIFFYIGFTLAALFLFSLKDARNLTDNIIYNMAITAGLGHAGGLLASVAVILSSIATLETTMLQFSRTLFAMGRDGAMPRMFGVVGEKTQTPVRAMYLLMAVGLALVWASSLMPSVNAIIASSVNAVAILVAYYYGLAGLVAAWVFRKTYRQSFLRWLGLCLFPAASALVLIGLGLYAITTFSMVTKIVGLGGFVAGVIFFRPSRYAAVEALPAAVESNA